MTILGTYGHHHLLLAQRNQWCSGSMEGESYIQYHPSSRRRVTVEISSLAFGTASVPEYDGTSIALNQDIIVVSINYRTNVFGFPGAPDLPLTGNNLGFMDQELALAWVQSNIANFGGDPEQSEFINIIIERD